MFGDLAGSCGCVGLWVFFQKKTKNWDEEGTGSFRTGVVQKTFREFIMAALTIRGTAWGKKSLKRRLAQLKVKHKWDIQGEEPLHARFLYVRLEQNSKHGWSNEIPMRREKHWGLFQFLALFQYETDIGYNPKIIQGHHSPDLLPSVWGTLRHDTATPSPLALSSPFQLSTYSQVGWALHWLSNCTAKTSLAKAGWKCIFLASWESTLTWGGGNVKSRCPTIWRTFSSFFSH